MTSFTLGQLADYLGASLQGDAQQAIRGLASLQEATPDDLSFLSTPKYAHLLKTTRAAALLLRPEEAAHFSGARLLLKDPYLGFARLTHLFDDPRPPAGERHPTAVIHPEAHLHPSVYVGPGAVIEAGCQLDEGVVVHAQCYLGMACQIGARTLLNPRVTLYRRTQIGRDCIIHSGAVIGADGFGFAPTDDGWEKIAQLGQVIIEEGVEVGANTTIDRGALGATRIGPGVKIDNQVMIGHNVQVGEATAMAAFVGISGSTQIGAHCLLGGSSGYAGHLKICDHVQITGMGMVTGHIQQPGSYSSGTGLLPSKEWRKSAVRFRQLDDLHHRLRALEQQAKEKP